MVYTELRSFMNEAFKGRANDIYTQAVSDCGIIDIDMATKEQRKKFADYLLKHYINFSPQKNRYLYEQLLNILEIGGMFSLRDYRDTVQAVDKKEESIILSSLVVYWHKVEQAFYKYEVILNLFWLKGVEAELHGANKEYVMKIIKQALVQIREDTKLAYQDLLEDLDLTRFQHRKSASFFKIKIFEETEITRPEDLPDGETYALLRIVNALHRTLMQPFEKIHALLLQSVEEDLQLRSQGRSDGEFIERLKTIIIAELEVLKSTYQTAYKQIEIKYKN